MINIEIPGRGNLSISYLVMDYNGTIAVDGQLLEGLEERVEKLCKDIEIYVLTADTYGTVKEQCEALNIRVKTFPKEGAGFNKEQIVKELGQGVACIGNGFNDIQMFDKADLSIAVLEKEGMYAGLLSHADILVKSPLDALDLLIKSTRICATLRT